MEKGKRIEAEFQLPDAIIQHIQSFMDGKEAAQTTILSKSWYTAWLTRPNLDFDQHHFLKANRSSNRFWEFVNKIMQRYERLNLKINSLRLRVQGKPSSFALVNKLIVKALELGATSLDFRTYLDTWEFVLPNEVFGSENLVSLSVGGCAIGSVAGGNVSVRCWGLKSLTLDEVRLQGNIIWDIISSCPLIENLSIVTSDILLSQFPVLGPQNVGGDIDWPFLKHEFHNLKRMLLCEVSFHPLYFDDFFSKFPCLKDLTLDHCYSNKVIQISSPTLEYINFSTQEDNELGVKFDVPNIRKFTCSSEGVVPLLSFKKTASTWESHISIGGCPYPCSIKWFLKLNKLLKKLSLSKVTLHLTIFPEVGIKLDEADIQCLSKPEVENLTITARNLVCPTLFYSLFQCCRPIYINQYLFRESCDSMKTKYDFMEFVYWAMLPQVGLNSCIAYQRMSGECDLEEVSVEFYDESVSAWRPQLLDTLSSIKAHEQKVRLHLRWRRQPSMI